MEPLDERNRVVQELKVLGRGSYGTAKLVKCASGETLVSKEITLSMMKPKDVLNTQKEIQILQSISHPNVVRYVDSYVQDNVLRILMEYCDGGDLFDLYTQSKAPLPQNTVISVLIQLLVGLKHLHDNRILHRDLKPQNVFLTKDNIVKLGDFGVATVLQQSAEFAKTLCGTPYYLAPELCEEKPYNTKADLWSLGCILYEVMTGGSKPFEAKSLLALVQKITKGDYDEIPPERGYSSDLTSIVYQLLQRLPLNRPTVRRILRNPFLRQKMMVVDSSLLQTDVYDKALQSSEALRLLAESGTQKGSSLSESELTDLEAWAANDKLKLQDGEARLGFRGKAFEDDWMTDRQRRIMLQLSSQQSGPQDDETDFSVQDPVGMSEKQFAL